MRRGQAEPRCFSIDRAAAGITAAQRCSRTGGRGASRRSPRGGTGSRGGTAMSCVATAFDASRGVFDGPLRAGSSGLHVVASDRLGSAMCIPGSIANRGADRDPALESPERTRSWRRPIFPKGCPLSIFGAGELDFRVRDGNGYGLSASVTSILLLDCDRLRPCARTFERGRREVLEIHDLVVLFGIRYPDIPFSPLTLGQKLKWSSPRPLVPLSFIRHRTSTCGLSSRWSTCGLTRLTRWGTSSPGELRT